MPQEMNVLCCYSCKMYQVHIVKKARKWQCKLCNAKQSVKQIYFQGSGKDCRLHVQHLNYLKTTDTSFFLPPEQENSYNDATSAAEELDIDQPIENKQAKDLDSPKKESSSSDTEDSSFNDIHEVEDTITNEKSLSNAVNNDSCTFQDTLDDCCDSDNDACDLDNFGSKDIANETENLYSTGVNYNPSIEDKCTLQDSDKSSKDHNDAINIFETYDELDDPLI
ncbi:PREDICTED: UPF0544 protein C5orf45 homolog [Vollenhovia emeryi]|uniref:UPF0544 protein C5orf45 homolog n=1 Tax=Vollenhovia emeryi TaxID=411798 RepID=UPI0005F53C76|nr:PREDICTED: UPF0544 protein C5orf45 homolog [Vollenhovia emeryi]